MGIVGGFVTFFMIWWTVLFAVLPWGVRHPDRPEKGMMNGAPLKPDFKKIFLVNTGVTCVIWLVVFLLAQYDVISFQRMADDMALRLEQEKKP